MRSVDVPAKLVDLLRAYRPEAGRTGWVFPSESDGPFNDRIFQQRHWQKAIVAPKAPYVGIHDLRHLYASVLLEKGAELLYVAAQLGHTSASFTLKQYGHVLRGSSPSEATLDAAF